MSSDAVSSDRSQTLLLRGCGLGKAYPASPTPTERLWQALSGAPPKKDAYVVLKDVDINVYRSETLGILGRNGAGKTTLLGVLGNLIEPTYGTVERFGKIAVLLEIGSGFNPEFTGRQNAALFCSIMGMGPAETEKRMPAILAFSELGEYFDMPIRTYSSGMNARLGFSCAIHVEADLIIIDETLAVGDVAFRAKCYAKIKAMQNQGQTFLIVSHSPNLVANFCTRVVVLEKGRKVFEGLPLEGLERYKEIRENIDKPKGGSVAAGPMEAEPDHPLWLEDFRLERTQPPSGPEICTVHAALHCRRRCDHPFVTFGLRNQEGIVVCSYDSALSNRPIPPMDAGACMPISMRYENRLLQGAYFFTARTGETIGDIPVTSSIHHNVSRLDVAGAGASRGLADLNLALDYHSELALERQN